MQEQENVNHEIIVSWNVKFFDLEFPYNDDSHTSVPTDIYLDSSLNQNLVKINVDQPGNVSYPNTNLLEPNHIADTVTYDPYTTPTPNIVSQPTPYVEHEPLPNETEHDLTPQKNNLNFHPRQMSYHYSKSYTTTWN